MPAGDYGSTDALPPLRIGCPILIVEDCLVSAEAMRLMARALGLRARTARTIDAAERHLAAFRPALVIVDLGLPDGEGEGLIARLAAEQSARARILAVSADETALAELGAEADAKALKPFLSVSDFAETVLPLLPGLVPAAGAAAEIAEPDPELVREDLARGRALAAEARALGDRFLLARAARFLTGLAVETGDDELLAASHRAADKSRSGLPVGPLADGLLSACRMQPGADLIRA